MCIPHGSTGTKSNGFVKKETPKKSIPKPSEEMMKKGDPDFIDERIIKEEVEKENFCDKIFGKKK